MAGGNGIGLIDFHSINAESTWTDTGTLQYDYQGRISCTGGTTSTGRGALSYQALTHYFDNYVNIGVTAQTTYPMRIKAGSGTSATSTWYTPNSNGEYSNSGVSHTNISIYAEGDIFTAQALATASDARTKHNISVTTHDSLAILSQLKVVYYDRIDTGSKHVLGFIAQDVHKVFPGAVRFLTDFVPTVFKLYPVECHNSILIVNEDMTEKLKNGDKVKFFDRNNAEIVGVVSEINTASTTFTMDKDYNDTEIFIYGPQVDDFHALDKHVIFTLCVESVQTLSRANRAMEDRITALEKLVGELVNSSR